MPTSAVMAGTVATERPRLRTGFALAWTVSLYWIVVFPLARRELRTWRQRARRIPDPVLRAHALHKLHSEGLTAEGAAAFAVLAARSAWRHVVRLCVAFEVIYDYVDALGEQATVDVLADNRQLYRALAAAFAPGAPAEDHYAHHPQDDDGGYLQELIAACRSALVQLPSFESALAPLQRLASRANEAQSLHHAAGAAGGDTPALARWAAAQQPPGDSLQWWELAAAASSPLGFFALVAAVSHRDVDVAETGAVERAYFPWIAALSWLLESLVDQEDDRETGEHSYVGHYGSPAAAARGLGAIAERAAADACGLRRGERHLVLLAGMASMYLSHPGASSPIARDAADAVRDAIGGPIVPLLWVLRLRRRAAA